MTAGALHITPLLGFKFSCLRAGNTLATYYFLIKWARVSRVFVHFRSPAVIYFRFIVHRAAFLNFVGLFSWWHGASSNSKWRRPSAILDGICEYVLRYGCLDNREEAFIELKIRISFEILQRTLEKQKRNVGERDWILWSFWTCFAHRMLESPYRRMRWEE